MVPDFSEQKIRSDCPFCDLDSWALKYRLKETQNFWLVCTSLPLVEGHVMIIPKKHLSCVGEFDNDLMGEFDMLYRETINFIKNHYGDFGGFEHGKIGQTVFHAHVHIFPYAGSLGQIIPEGSQYLFPVDDFVGLRKAYADDGQYLFLSVGGKKWLVDSKLAVPAFFLGRFAKAMGREGRVDWKAMPNCDKTMKEASDEIKSLQQCWSTGHLARVSAAVDLQIRKTE